MTKRTTGSDRRDGKCEQRAYIARTGTSEHGRSTLLITCPFCDQEVTVFIWSFRSVGKSCGCGALIDSVGFAHKRIDK